MASVGRVNSPCYGCCAPLGQRYLSLRHAWVMQLLRVEKTASWQSLTYYKVRGS